MRTRPLPSEDLDSIVEQSRESFIMLRGARIFLTGGTGFFGHWLLESLLRANGTLGLDVNVTVLTRNAARFRTGSPWIAEDTVVTLLEGDVRRFEFPAGRFTHVIHAATDSGGQQQESELTAEIVEGTRKILELAHNAGCGRLLYVSSGAVYGRSTTLLHTPESYAAGPLPVGSYEAAKLAAERLCVASGVPTVVARCFAFVGPRLPLDAHFAIGNFLGAAMTGRMIEVRGDGTPRRSWMYMSDLAVWLWTLLAQGQSGRAYNVGSEEAYSIADAARVMVDTLAPGLGVRVLGTPSEGAALNSYVPSVERARSELGLRVTVPLCEALVRTARWHSSP